MYRLLTLMYENWLITSFIIAVLSFFAFAIIDKVPLKREAETLSVLTLSVILGLGWPVALLIYAVFMVLYLIYQSFNLILFILELSFDKEKRCLFIGQVKQNFVKLLRKNKESLT